MFTHKHTKHKHKNNRNHKYHKHRKHTNDNKLNKNSNKPGMENIKYKTYDDVRSSSNIIIPDGYGWDDIFNMCKEDLEYDGPQCNICYEPMDDDTPYALANNSYGKQKYHPECLQNYHNHSKTAIIGNDDVSHIYLYQGKTKVGVFDLNFDRNDNDENDATELTPMLSDYDYSGEPIINNGNNNMLNLMELGRSNGSNEENDNDEPRSKKKWWKRILCVVTTCIMIGAILLYIFLYL
jgi:hypothetical protein